MTATRTTMLLLAFKGVVSLTMPNGTGNTVMFAPFLAAPIAKIPTSFLSFNFDWNLNRSSGDAWTNASMGWTLDLSDKRLETLASALAPANLRVGGSNADVAEYAIGFPHGGRNCSSHAREMHVCLEPARWDEIIAFCQRTGLRLAFDLNIMLGRDAAGAGAWDSTNARALLSYTAHKYPAWATRSNLGFELGNEKGASSMHSLSLSSHSASSLPPLPPLEKEFVLTAVQTAEAFIELRNIVDDVFGGE